MTPAIRAAHAGLKVLIAEKTEYLGGTTAISGGMPWVPANHLMIEGGIPDTKEAAYTYLQHTVGNRMRPDMIKAYLDAAPEMVRYFVENTEVKFAIRPDMPDYASEAPGATLGGRCLEPVVFDGRRLGDQLKRLRPPRKEMTVFGGMMVNAADVGHLLRARHSARSFLHAAKLIAKFALDRAFYGRGTRLVAGNALAARLLKSVVDAGVELWTNAEASRLLKEGDRIVGAIVHRDGALIRVEAKYATILATGGFPQSGVWKSAKIPFAEQHQSMAPKDNVGSGLDLAIDIGATLDTINDGAAFLTPVSIMRKADGRTLTFPHLIADRAKPGVIAVNRRGRRFVNEAESYHDFVMSMRHNDGEGIPAYLICDSRFIGKYGLGMVRPTPFPRRSFVRNGYLYEADTIEGLAKKLGIDPTVLRSTIERYNADAHQGVDTEFGKGNTYYNRYMGDKDHKPNPCIAPIERAPYYAVKLQTGDIGTALGLRVNPKAQVLDKEDRPIDGLYAVGNDMNSVMAGTYATGGITIGPAMTFGYIAANDIIAHAKGDPTAST